MPKTVAQLFPLIKCPWCKSLRGRIERVVHWKVRNALSDGFNRVLGENYPSPHFRVFMIFCKVCSQKFLIEIPVRE